MPGFDRGVTCAVSFLGFADLGKARRGSFTAFGEALLGDRVAIFFANFGRDLDALICESEGINGEQLQVSKIQNHNQGNDRWVALCFATVGGDRTGILTFNQDHLTTSQNFG